MMMKYAILKLMVIFITIVIVATGRAAYIEDDDFIEWQGKNGFCGADA
jgi:hypothetical protein